VKTENGMQLEKYEYRGLIELMLGVRIPCPTQSILIEVVIF
jgi:hypothetical protein